MVPAGGRVTRNRPAGPGRRRAVALAPALALLLLPSCKPNQRYDLLEAELRTTNRELAEARAALEHARAVNRAYNPPGLVVANTHLPAADGGSPGGVPAAGIQVTDITLARGTGAADDGTGFVVNVVPRDADGSAVKVPATLKVAAWQVSPQGLKTPIGTWELPPDKLRRAWTAGLLTTGYSATLPWQTTPGTGRVRVAVRLTTADGRAFEADREFTVTPTDATPFVPSTAAVNPVPAVGPLPPVQGRPVEELPPPTPEPRR